MARRIDLTGRRFGRLTVIRYDHAEHDGAHWLCKCDCGTEKVIAGYLLRNGATKSCGCLKSDASRANLEKAREDRKARPRKDLTGQRFGRLVVLGLADVPDRKGFIFWRVRCDCGTEKNHHAEQFHLRPNAILRLSLQRNESGKSRTHADVQKAEIRLDRENSRAGDYPETNGCRRQEACKGHSRTAAKNL